MLINDNKTLLSVVNMDVYRFIVRVFISKGCVCICAITRISVAFHLAYVRMVTTTEGGFKAYEYKFERRLLG